MNCFKPQLLSIPIMCWAVAGVLTLATPPPVQAVPLPWVHRIHSRSMWNHQLCRVVTV